MLSLVLLFAQDPPPQGDFFKQLVGFLPIILMGVLFFWMMSRMKRQEAEQRVAMMASLKNDKVLTNGGIIGIIAALKDNEDEVTLKVDESSNVRLRVLKSSIVRIYGPETSDKEQKESGN